MTKEASTQSTAMRFKCPNCGVLLQSAAARPGGRFACPKCKATGVIPNPKGDSAEYGLGEIPTAPNLPSYALSPPSTSAARTNITRKKRVVPGGVDGSPRTASERSPYSTYRRPTLPTHPMIEGIFDFFSAKEIIALWIALTAGLTLLLGCLVVGLLVGGIAQSGLAGGFVGSVTGMVLFGVVGVAGLLWSIPAFVQFLNITTETATGNRMVENLPDVIWLDWIQDSLFVIVPMMAAGMGAVMVGGYVPFATEWVILSLFLLLFPIFALSALDQQACYAILSLRVARSLGFAGSTWLAFFVETAALLIAVGVVDLIGSALISAIGGSGILLFVTLPMAVLFMAAEIVTVMMIYFRLLGRLAWVIEERERETEVEEEDEE